VLYKRDKEPMRRDYEAGIVLSKAAHYDDCLATCWALLASGFSENGSTWTDNDRGVCRLYALVSEVWYLMAIPRSSCRLDSNQSRGKHLGEEVKCQPQWVQCQLEM
jgi:hypothetical protein